MHTTRPYHHTIPPYHILPYHTTIPYPTIPYHHTIPPNTKKVLQWMFYIHHIMAEFQNVVNCPPKKNSCQYFYKKKIWHLFIITKCITEKTKDRKLIKLAPKPQINCSWFSRISVGVEERKKCGCSFAPSLKLWAICYFCSTSSQQTCKNWQISPNRYF